MEPPYPTRRTVLRVSRRELLKAGLAAGVTLSAWPLAQPPALGGAEAGPPKRGGILRVRGWDPPHFDPHLTIAPATHFTLSLVYSRLVRSPTGVTWEPDGRLYRAYASDSSRNVGHVDDARLTAMLKAQRRTKDLEARKKLIFDIQRYVAEQQYYVYLNSTTITTSWQPYVKNFAPNHSFDYGNRAAVLWLER